MCASVPTNNPEVFRLSAVRRGYGHALAFFHGYSSAGPVGPQFQRAAIDLLVNKYTYVLGTILMLVFLLDVSLLEVESDIDPLGAWPGLPRQRRYLKHKK